MPKQAALEVMSETLRLEMRPLNVAVFFGYIGRSPYLVFEYNNDRRRDGQNRDNRQRSSAIRCGLSERRVLRRLPANHAQTNSRPVPSTDSVKFPSRGDGEIDSKYVRVRRMGRCRMDRKVRVNGEKAD